MKKILRYLRSSLGYLYVCFKWVILAAPGGLCSGAVWRNVWAGAQQSDRPAHG